MKRILVLRDSHTNLGAYEDALRGLGHECVSSDAAGAGLHTVRKADADVLVVDVDRPNDSHMGIRVIEELRDDQQFEKFPIVLCTDADGQQATVVRISLLGVPIVERPFHADELGGAISYAMARAIE